MGRLEDRLPAFDPRDQSYDTPGGLSELDTGWQDGEASRTPEEQLAWQASQAAVLRAVRTQNQAGLLAVAAGAEDEQDGQDDGVARVTMPVVVAEKPVSSADESESGPSKTKRRAFGYFLKTWQYDPEGKYDLASVTPEQVGQLNPQWIADYLFKPSMTIKGGGQIFRVPVDARRQASLHIALNPVEYALLPRVPEAFARQAQAQTLGANDLSEDSIQKSKRSVVHAFDSKLEKVVPHRAKLLTAQQQIRELRALAAQPGYAHKTEFEMTQLMGAAWNEFTTMLDVVHTARNWTDEQRVQAEATLLKQLTTEGQRTKTGVWQFMLEVADNYLDQRIAAFGSRISQVRQLRPDID